jgi:hypothetical protein
MKYIIHSKSERGFWSNKTGWVYSIKDATVYDDIRVLKQPKPVILSKENDAEWLVYTYDE